MVHIHAAVAGAHSTNRNEAHLGHVKPRDVVIARNAASVAAQEARAFDPKPKFNCTHNRAAATAATSSAKVQVKPAQDKVSKKIDCRKVHIDAAVAEFNLHSTHRSRAQNARAKQHTTAAIRLREAAGVREAAAVMAQKALRSTHGIYMLL